MTAQLQLQVVRVRCQADGGRCRHVLADVIGPLKFVGLRARRPDVPDGRVWLQCGRIDCRTWNVFDAPATTQVVKHDE